MHNLNYITNLINEKRFDFYILQNPFSCRIFINKHSFMASISQIPNSNLFLIISGSNISIIASNYNTYYSCIMSVSSVFSLKFHILRDLSPEPEIIFLSSRVMAAAYTHAS